MPLCFGPQPVRYFLIECGCRQPRKPHFQPENRAKAPRKHFFRLLFGTASSCCVPLRQSVRVCKLLGPDPQRQVSRYGRRDAGVVIIAKDFENAVQNCPRLRIMYNSDSQLPIRQADSRLPIRTPKAWTPGIGSPNGFRITASAWVPDYSARVFRITARGSGQSDAQD